jgi:hypothetical protein
MIEAVVCLAFLVQQGRKVVDSRMRFSKRMSNNLNPYYLQALNKPRSYKYKKRSPLYVLLYVYILATLSSDIPYDSAKV